MSLPDKTRELQAKRGWTEWTLFMLMTEYLEQGGFLEEFHEFCEESAKIEDQEQR